MAVINQYYESQEEYWAREIVWAVKMIEKNGDALNNRRIRNLTNLRRDNMLDSMKELEKNYPEVYAKIEHII